jgi:hypothetical protein
MLAAAACVLAPAAHAGGPALVLGATEDAVRVPTIAEAKAQMDLLVIAGFHAVRISQVWTPGDTELSEKDRTSLQNVVTAAALDHVQVLTTVMNQGSRTTPLTDEDQADFATFAASIVAEFPELRTFIVGNEPNLNRYWLPQYDEGGGDAAAPAYENLLALTYDAIKAADPTVTVLGGAVSPRGADKPDGLRPTHSPTVFIHDMGQAYRDSGRTDKIMDGFAFHPYEDNSSAAPITGTHVDSTTIALADYNKLVASLGEAFGDYTIPIWYDEFGVESRIPALKKTAYTGTEPTTTKPVTETTQALYYRQALQLTFCQPNVQGIFLFHTVDEKGLGQWQSGVYYADNTPKTSLTAVKTALEETRRGVIARCDGMQLPVRPKLAQGPRGTITVTCDLDCLYTARLYRLPSTLVRTRHGRAIGGRATKLAFRFPKVKGTWRVRLTAVAPVNPGPTALVQRNVRRS